MAQLDMLTQIKKQACHRGRLGHGRENSDTCGPVWIRAGKGRPGIDLALRASVLLHRAGRSRRFGASEIDSMLVRALLAAALCFAIPTSFSNGTESEARMSLSLSSPSFAPNAPIPVRHTCDGDELSPPLRWSGLPAGTKSLALIVDDPDAPDPAKPRVTWVHWLLYNLPATDGGLAEGISASQLPQETREGLNDWHRTGYGGPCPPVGRHRYVHKLYALDTVLPDLGRPDKARLLKAMEGHVLARAELIGTYQR